MTKEEEKEGKGVGGRRVRYVISVSLLFLYISAVSCVKLQAGR